MGSKISQLSLLFAFTTGIVTQQTVYAQLDELLQIDGQNTQKTANTLQYQTSPNSKVLDALLRRVVTQLVTIDKTLEELAQSVNNNSIKVDDKKAIRDYITDLRSFILEVRQGKQFELNHVNLPLVLNVNKSLLELINTSLRGGLKRLPSFQAPELVRRSRTTVPTKLSTLKTVLDSNEEQLKSVAKNYSFVGSTRLNRIAKKTTQVANDWYIPAITKRVVPYIGLAAYYIVLNSKEQLPGYKAPTILKLVTPANSQQTEEQLPDYKAPTIAEAATPTAGKDSNKEGMDSAQQQIITYNTIDNMDAVGHFFQNLKHTLGALPKKQVETTPKPDILVEVPINAQKQEVRDIHRIAEDLVAVGQQIANQTLVQKEVAQSGSGLIGNLMNPLGRLICLDTSKPFFTIIPATFFAPIIIKDAKDLAGWTLTQTIKSLAYLKGETFDTGSPVKSSRSNFSDVIGLSQAKAELGKLVSYFKHKSTLDRTGSAVERGYLLVGPADAGKALAHAVAGEITKELKAQGKTDKCGVYDIHASALLKKELSEIIKEADKATPAIIVINELDWLARQEVEAKVWGDIVTNMTGAIKNPKKPVIIIATAQDAQALDTVLTSRAQLGVSITFGQPTDEDRVAFFTRELANYGVAQADFNITDLARQTAGSSLAMLGTVVKHALNRAHIAQRSLTHDDIEQSINTLVYGISAQNRTLLPIEKQVLAAHYAGKMVVHNALSMPEQLVKATILPVTTSAGTQQGALFTYAPEHRALTTTQQDKEKACVIELAGLAAQEALFGSVSHKLAQETKQKVFAQAKDIVFEGIDQQDLPKELKQQKLVQAWKLVEEYTQQARTLLQEQKEALERIVQQLETEQTITVYYSTH